MNPLRIFLMATLILVVFGSTEVDAGSVLKNPEWSYDTGENINSVDISANGEYIVAGSSDNNTHFFSKDSSEPIWSYEAGDSIYSVAISSNGEYIVAGGGDNFVYLFSKDNATPLWKYDVGGYVFPVSISGDGEYIVVGNENGDVYFFDKDSSDPLWSYGTYGWVNSISISAEGEYIAVGTGEERGGYAPNGGKVYLFDKDSNTPLWKYDPERVVLSVSISADGEYITAGTTDDNVHLFHKDSSTPLWTYEALQYVGSVAISADGEYIIAGDYNSDVYFFHKDNNTPLWRYHTEGGRIFSVAISADGEYIAVGGYDYSYFFLKDSNTPLWHCPTENKAWDVALATTQIVVGDNKIYLFDNYLPKAVINSITPSPPIFGEEIIFDGSGTDIKGRIVKYSWESSIDGELSTTLFFSNTNLSVGDHIITFQVWDDDGWTHSVNTLLRVYAAPIPNAGVNLVTTPNTEIQFVGSGKDKDGFIVKYEWDFDGDGEFDWSSEDNGITTFIYNKEGKYEAILRVTDNDGFTATDSRLITVSEEDESSLPSVSMIPALISIGLVAIYRRK
jgi:WD40 repeat protein